MELKTVKIEMPEECNVILGTAHFIKTVEDIYEALVNAVPNIKFGIGFCESSGPCLVRSEGNDKELKSLAITGSVDMKRPMPLIQSTSWIRLSRCLKSAPSTLQQLIL